MAARNSSIDFLKLGLSLLIIALHIFPVSGIKGWQGLVSYEIVNGITRIGVPTFFIISGYFLRNKLQDKSYLLKYGKRILLLYIIWQLIYLPDLIRFYRLGKFNTFEGILKLIWGYWHLWYLLATVGAVLLLYLFRNLSLQKKVTHAVILFLIGYTYQLLYKTGTLDDFQFLKIIYEGMGTTRNFVFMAYPFLLVGTLYDSWNSSVSKLKFLFWPFTVLLLTESFLYYSLQIGALDFYILLIPVSMTLFSLAAECKKQPSLQLDTTLSLGIYLCHPYAIRVVYEFLPQRSLGFIFLKYVLICVLALVFWFVLSRVNKRFPYLF